MSENTKNNNINSENAPSDTNLSESNLDSNTGAKNTNLEQIEQAKQETNNPKEKTEKEILFKNIENRTQEFSGNLAWKESLQTKFYEENVHSAYYLNWIQESNDFFKRAAYLRRRLTRYKDQ